MPHHNPIDIASLATELTATLEADGIDAMFQKLEDALRHSCRWHSLFDAHLLRARAALGLPLVGPVADTDKVTKKTLDDKTIAACREVGWKLFDEGQIASGWMYLRAAVEPQEVADKLSQIASQILEQEESVADEEEYQPLQEIIQLALWENLDPALGIRVMLAAQGTCNAVTAYEQSVAGLPPTQQEPVAKIMIHHLHEEVFENLARDLIERELVDTNQINEIKGRKGALVDLLATAGGLLNEESIHVDASHLQAVLRFARISTDSDDIQHAHALACYACRLPREFQYPGDTPFSNFGTSSRLFYSAQLGEEADQAIAFFRQEAEQANEYEAPAAWDVLAVLAARINRLDEALSAILARPAETGTSQNSPLAATLPPLVELAHGAVGGEKLRAACIERDDLITYAASLARDSTS
jgi:hypothetical protein